MATLDTGSKTLAEWGKMLDPDGQVARIVELLEQTNEILEDMQWMEGNLPTGHQTTVRTRLPSPTWRKLYQGVTPTTSGETQIIANTGMLEAYAQTDKALADLNQSLEAFLLEEAKAHMAGMSDEFAETAFYGNEGTEPEAFTGLAPFYDDLSDENADNIVDHGGTGSDNTSIWLVVWGQDTVFGIFPRNSKAGIDFQNLGEKTHVNSDGSMYQVYRSHFVWKGGLVVRDWRYVVRICNIDVSDLETLANTKDLITSMIKASERIPKLGMGKACWYVNRNIREKLRLGINEKIANNLTWETVEGKRVMTFDDIPVRRCDAILGTESRVT